MSAEEREQQYRLQIDSLNALTKKMLDAAGNDEAKRQKIIEASAIAEKALKSSISKRLRRRVSMPWRKPTPSWPSGCKATAGKP